METNSRIEELAIEMLNEIGIDEHEATLRFSQGVIELIRNVEFVSWLQYQDAGVRETANRLIDVGKSVSEIVKILDLKFVPSV